jgi:hypothetical protein
MGVPVTLSGANTPTPTFIAPIVPKDTVLGFSLKVMDDHGSISTNPAVAYIMIKHHNAAVANGAITSTTNPANGSGNINQQLRQNPSTSFLPPIFVR